MQGDGRACSQERGSKGFRKEYMVKREEKQSKTVISASGELQADPVEKL